MLASKAAPLPATPLPSPITTGARIGRWTVGAPNRDSHGRPGYRCACECGKRRIIYTQRLEEMRASGRDVACRDCSPGAPQPRKPAEALATSTVESRRQVERSVERAIATLDTRRRIDGALQHLREIADRGYVAQIEQLRGELDRIVRREREAGRGLAAAWLAALLRADAYVREER